MIIPDPRKIVGESDLITPIGIHDINFRIPIPTRDKNDLSWSVLSKIDLWIIVLWYIG